MGNPIVRCLALAILVLTLSPIAGHAANAAKDGEWVYGCFVAGENECHKRCANYAACFTECMRCPTRDKAKEIFLIATPKKGRSVQDKGQLTPPR
jgi:hypothetical protein